MKRRGAGVVVLLAATGCLVAEPPSYQEPRRTPPILDLYSAKPFTGAVIAIDRTDSLPGNSRIDFKIPVRSDDQGEELIWVLSYDRTFASELPAGQATVPPSTLDDTTRYVQHTWRADPQFREGCHTLSFVVAHESSWNKKASPPELLDATDAAVGTWWINIDPLKGTDPNTLPRCPNRTEIQQ